MILRKGKEVGIVFIFHLQGIRRTAILSWLSLLFSLLPDMAGADGITGYLDYNFSTLSSKTTIAQGETSDIKSTTFDQQYNVTFIRTLYPNLRFLANGIFERDLTKTNVDGNQTTARTTIMRPLLDLTLKTPFYLAGVNYTRREEKDVTTGSPANTTVNEQYNAVFGWLPVGFPSVDLRLSRTNNYDKAGLIENMTEDFGQLTANFEPVKDLFLKYQGSYRDTKDKLNLIETKEFTNNGRTSYDGNFFKDRVTLSTSYDATVKNTDITTSGTGEVGFPLVPAAGLFLLDNTNTPTLNTLNATPFLIDGDKTGTGGNVIDLGFSPALSGDNNNRDLGLNFGSIVTVNALRIWVDRALQSATAAQLSFDIYTSTDNSHWTLFQTHASATFGPFENRFELRFPIVNTQYIKAVVKPLPGPVPQPGVDHIFVTEMGALIFKTAGDIKGTTSSTNTVFNIYVRTRILDVPYLFYDFSYFSVRATGIVSTLRSTLSNGLSANHQMGDIITVNGRVAREDSKDVFGSTTAYISTASIRAIPFRTLSHTLTYSGRSETNPQGKLKRNSFFLYNTADLYKGLSVFLSGGYSYSTLETGRQEDTTSLSFGSNIVPNDKITLTLNYTSSVTEDTGADLPASTTDNKRGDLTVAIRPVQTVYIFASLSKVVQNNTNDTLQNYSLNWAPFPGGALQFTFTYNENLRAEDKSVERIIRPGLRWNITKRSFLDLSFLSISSKSNIQTVNSKIYNAELRIPF